MSHWWHSGVQRFKCKALMLRISLQKSVKESKVSNISPPRPTLHELEGTEKYSVHKKQNISSWTINSSECLKHKILPCAYKQSFFSITIYTQLRWCHLTENKLKLVLHLSLVIKKTNKVPLCVTLLKMEVSDKKWTTKQSVIWGGSSYLKDYFLPFTVWAIGVLPWRQFIMNSFL